MLKNTRHHSLVAWQRADDLEKDLNGVGAPLAGLVRSTRLDLTLSVSIVVLAALAIYFAA